MDQRTEYELRTSQLLERQARKHGFHFLDLAEYFADDFEANQQKFESELDYHWNELGHAVAARALAQTLKRLP